MPYKVIVIAGPTAVGKTEYAIRIANAFDGEIVSCDSMQIYRYMDIGSAKPTPEERKKAVHHLIDFVDPHENFSVAKYQKIARDTIEEISIHGKLPVIEGGTGLYLNSILYEMDFGSAPKHDEYRESLYKYAEKYGQDNLHNKLMEIDPESAERIHPHNVKRVIRALEAAEMDEKPLQDFSLVRRKDTAIEPIMLGLTRKRENLYNRIDIRVDKLIDDGLLDEVNKLMTMGFGKDDISMKGIGYKELIAYMEGEYDLEEAIRLIKRNTRRYAKRQLTWFRRYKEMKWFDLDEYKDENEASEDILQWLRTKM